MFSSYRRRFGTTKAVLILGSVYLASQIVIGSIIHDMGSLEFLKAQTTFSRTAYVEQVKQWQERELLSCAVHLRCGCDFFLDDHGERVCRQHQMGSGRHIHRHRYRLRLAKAARMNGEAE